VNHDAIVEAPGSERIEAVYREEAPRLWRALIAFSGNPDIAADAVAESFAQALRRGDALDDPTRWVWRAGYRIAAGELLAQSRRSEQLRTSPGGSTLDLTERSIELIDALARLPDKQRAVMVLHYLVDLPTAEIARRLGVSAVTVRVHLNQGRRRMRTLLEENDD
jgi:RNA polymerase sigma-70 factor (ECF subfamily)